ncbi:hypothetical protein BC828DRAFT_376420 [Blastocladiella britannica]|nr:hypothetical protein BC828DRAFT_376420 [Blastocladiella britannica]
MAAPLVELSNTINSVVVSGIGLITAGVTAAITFRRVFPKGATDHFVPSTSSLSHTMSRHQLLLATSICMALDSARGGVYYGYIWFYPENVIVAQIASRIAYLSLFHPSTAMLTLAACQRYAVVTTNLPRWRHWFVRGASLCCLTCMVILVAGSIENLLVLLNSWPSAAVWRATLFNPDWASPVLVVLPALSLLGTVWSLQLSFQDRQTISSLATSGTGATAAASRSSKERIPSGATASVGSGSPPPQRPSLKTRQLKIGRIQPLSGPSRSRSASTRTTISYTLSYTFKLLSVAQMIMWSMIIFCVFRTTLGAVRTNAINDLMLAIGALVEVSFESLLRAKIRSHARHHKNLDNHFVTATIATGELESNASSTRSQSSSTGGSPVTPLTPISPATHFHSNHPDGSVPSSPVQVPE